MTRIHLVNGFLGSGKTTAIVQAARQHIAGGERVGIVTNDQGRFLVDTAFVQAEHIPVVQVTGGCFCCSFDQLLDVLTELNANARPEVIYAESVGSCADLIATVVLPLRARPELDANCESLSVFTDSRLLLRRLRGEPLPFSDQVLYILDRQMDEAGVLILNKADLLDADARAELEGLARARLPGTPLISQNSLDATEVSRWRELVESGQAPAPAFPIPIDYDRYGAGETQLAWVDRALMADLAGDGRAQVIRVIQAVVETLREHQAPVAHLKFHLSSADSSAKLSFTMELQGGWQAQIPHMQGPVELLLNARIQADSQMAGMWVDAALARAIDESGAVWRVARADTLTPQAPQRPWQAQTR